MPLPPEELVQDCQSVGYPEYAGGSYVSRREFSCETWAYGPWEHEDGCFIYDGPDHRIDFRRYWPEQTSVVTTRLADTSIYGAYTFGPAGDLVLPESTLTAQQVYQQHLDQKTPGSLYLWHKAYGTGPCLSTIAHFHFGDDWSVIEAGDWLASAPCSQYIAFGYTNPTHTAPDGLAWSAPGGLRSPTTSGASPIAAERYGLGTSRQLEPGGPYQDYGPKGFRAWNKNLVIEALPAFTPAYGRDASGWGPGRAQTYRNVIRVVMFHGTATPVESGYKDIDCSDQVADIPGYPAEYFYLHLPGYNSYVSEYYFARGKGLLQETLLYVENGAYWKQPDCSMGLMFSQKSDPKATQVSYRDDPP